MIDVIKKEPPKSEVATHTIIVKGVPLKPTVLTDIVVQKPKSLIKPIPVVNSELVLFEIY